MQPEACRFREVENPALDLLTAINRQASQLHQPPPPPSPNLGGGSRTSDRPQLKSIFAAGWNFANRSFSSRP